MQFSFRFFSVGSVSINQLQKQTRGLRGRCATKSGRVISRGVACDKMTMYMDLLCLCHSTCLRYNDVACDKMTMYMDLLCLCHSTCLRYNESAGLTRRCMSFYARLANCQPPLIAPFDLCRLNSERNSYIRITTQAESALSCGGYW